MEAPKSLRSAHKIQSGLWQHCQSAFPAGWESLLHTGDPKNDEDREWEGKPEMGMGKGNQELEIIPGILRLISFLSLRGKGTEWTHSALQSLYLETMEFICIYLPGCYSGENNSVGRRMCFHLSRMWQERSLHSWCPAQNCCLGC